VTLPVRVVGAQVGDAVALHVEKIEQVSRATTSGTHTGWDGRYISDPFVAGICSTCRDAGRHFLYPDTYLDGTGESAVRCATCHSEVIPFHMVEGYTMVFDDAMQLGVTVTSDRAKEIAQDGRAWLGLTEHSHQHPIVSLARADLVGVMTRCRISVGNLGSIPAVDLPSSHNCGDFGAFLVGADHEFAVTEEELEQRTGAAYAAKTRLQLQRLTQDLPGAPDFGPDQREPIADEQHVPARAPCLLTVLACCGGWPRHWRS